MRKDGSIKWRKSFVFVGEAVARECVGIRPLDDDRHAVHLGPMRLGVLNDRLRTVMPSEPEQ